MTVCEEACGGCLRRGELVGRLSPRIAGLLGRRRRGRPSELLSRSDEDLVSAVGGEAADDLQAWLADFDQAAAVDRVRVAGLECICRHSDAYPRALDSLDDPPAALYLAGGRPRFEELAREPAATIVGTRHCTPYGREVALSLGRSLAGAGVTVVSGMALGIDAAAHRGVLGVGDGALAVVASGADVAYPATHLPLYEQVRERGVVVSELPPGTAPMRWSFPARNRIMAALGRITIVVEAAERSGSLITAAFAGDIGRDVGAVPGQVTNMRARGSNRLLRDGAQLIRGAEDALDLLFGAGGAEAARARLGAGRAGGAGGVRKRAAQVPLEPPVRRVLEAVEAGHRIDAIGREATLSPAQVRAALGRLEVLGLVARDGLGLYERVVDA